MKKFKTEFFLGAAILFWIVFPVWSQGWEMDIEQTLSDEGQRTTIAFDALAFLTGTLGADSFFPPGKVADFWGFQYLRDNDPTQMGHNTDFLTKAAQNVLFILTSAQLVELVSLAQSQVADINQYAYDRFVLMKAFRRLLERDVPKGRPSLDIDAIKAYSEKLYQLDGQMSIQRAEVMGHIIQSLDAGQRNYLNTMVGRGMLTWPNVPNSLNPRDYTHDVHVAIMTYAGDIFSWYAGSIDADVYFCPERQGTYFGSFYLKAAPAVGNPNYSISTSLTGDMGNAFLAALTPTQSQLVIQLVEIQKPWLYEIVNVRREICSLLREAMAGEALDSSMILSLAALYGELDGEIIYSYATNFVRIYRTLSAEQKASLIALRKEIIGDLAPEGAYLYAEQIPMPDIPNTDFLYSSLTIPDQTHTLYVNSSPSTGAYIEVTPNDRNGAGNGNSNFTRVYDPYSDVTLTAPSAFGGKPFHHWNRGDTGSSASYVYSYNQSINIAVDRNHLMEVVYTLLYSLSKTSLSFGATTSGQKTEDQKFEITSSSGNFLDWSISTSDSWLSSSSVSSTGIEIAATNGTGNAVINVSVNPSGMGPGTYQGRVTVSPTSADNSPQNINVYLKVWEAGTDSFPFGSFDTPVNGSTVSGSVAVTGWALDDIEVTKVEIKRAPDPDDPPATIGSDGLIYIGDSVFVQGSRPDVEALYPDSPLNDRVGWGYMMLTYGLSRLGNGTFTLYAFAEDASGHRVLLGTKQIICNNANRVQPFGSIDTPGQGEVILGNYVNFGWALTPPPCEIARDGSTLRVSIDGVYIARPDYNHFRQDVYDSFPGYINRDGAIGFYWLDTTKYANGVHNIGWYAWDDCSNADGFGSRFFEIQNVGGSSLSVTGMESLRYREDTSGRLKINVEGPQEMEVEQLERIEIQLQVEGGNRIIGWGEDETKSLPIGSTLDGEKGMFYWSIGPGFLREHILHFAVTDGVYISQPVEVIVNIVPKRYKIDRVLEDRKIKRFSFLNSVFQLLFLSIL